MQMREASELQGNIVVIIRLIFHNSPRLTAMTGQMADSRAFWFEKWNLTGSSSIRNAADSADGDQHSADEKILEEYSSCGYY